MKGYDIYLPRNSEYQLFCFALSELSFDEQIDNLSPLERVRTRKYRHQEDVEMFVKSRGILRVVLAGMVNEEAQKLAISEKHGKPLIHSRPDLHFNLSRSCNKISLVVSRTPIGIDMEYINDNTNNHSVATHFFHTREQNILNNLTDASWTRAFYRIWTQKEALVKAMGVGFQQDFHSFSTNLNGGKILIDNAPVGDQNWYGFLLDIIPECQISLVGQRPAPDIRIVKLPAPPQKPVMPDTSLSQTKGATKNRPGSPYYS